MHIIVVSSRLAKARSLSITPVHIALGSALLLLLILATASVLLVLSLRYAERLGVPQLEALVASAREHESRRTESFVQVNLDAMAVKLGQMQAQLTRLDALGERVSTLAGLKPAEFRFSESPGRGGALSASSEPQSLSMNDLSRRVEAVSRQMETRTDQLELLENALFDARAKKRLMPTVRPVEAAWNASSFGWRIDPFSGQQAMHEGMDFIAEVGTPIVAAAGGVVTYAAFHHQYGNMVEIDHGNDFVTRYAHAHRLHVKAGDVVRRGRKIAEVGSTGRSTGPHLHFEVRYKGVAQNPARFLRASVR
jgi:murein DD-endopeptidase MepM/ murein hydrolase activator NlpD